MSLTKEQIAAHVEELRLQGQACEGFTVGVVAALTFITAKAAGMAPADLAGLPEQSLWQAACKAHHKQPNLVHSLPDTIPMSRGEWFAVTHGLAKQHSELPTGKDLLGLVRVIYGEPMFRAWTAIVYPHAHALTISEPVSSESRGSSLRPEEPQAGAF